MLHSARSGGRRRRLPKHRLLPDVRERHSLRSTWTDQGLTATICKDPDMGYHAVRGDEHEYEERTFVEGQAPRLSADVTTSARLQHSRGRIWRYPPRTRGRRHSDRVQEEVFVVLSGTLTMLLGDPPERVDLPAQSVVAVEPMTPLQARNETDEELVLYIYGAPPEQAGAEFFDDPGDL